MQLSVIRVTSFVIGMGGGVVALATVLTMGTTHVSGGELVVLVRLYSHD